MSNSAHQRHDPSFSELPPLQNSKENSLGGHAMYTGVRKKCDFYLFEIAVYLGNDTKQPRGYYEPLIGSRRLPIAQYHCSSDVE